MDVDRLFWLVLVSFVGVVAVIVRLLRSGRAVPLPTIRMRPPQRADHGA